MIASRFGEVVIWRFGDLAIEKAEAQRNLRLCIQMALEAIVNQPGLYRVVLEEYPEGVYVLVYDSPDDPKGPCEDHLQDNWTIAKRQAREDFGITEEQWKEIPDTRFNG